MDHARVVLRLSIPVLLAGCDIGGVGAEQEALGKVDGEEAQPLAKSSVATSDTIGSIRYFYDATQLTMTEVMIEIPPDYRSRVPASKLIPSQRVAMLGQELCQYGQSDRLETCEAEKEAGLALALLERPLADYHGAFVQAGLADELSPNRFGFTYTTRASGRPTEFRFLRSKDHAVLVARQPAGGNDASEDAVRDVLRSIARELDGSSG